MANNIDVLDAASATQTVKTTDTAGVHTPHQNIDSVPGTAAESAALPSVFLVIAGDDGTDTHPIQVDASGYLKIISQANSGVDIGDVDVTSLPALASGSNVVGKVGIDQTTPGTTNLVQVGGSLPAGTAAIGKLAANSGVDIGDVDVTSIAAGETHIGEVGANSNVVTVAPTVSTTPAYTAGDNIGGKITLANAVRVSGGTAMLSGIMILDRSNQKPAGQIIIFNADPTTATLTDNAATVLSTDDLKVSAVIPIAATDYVTINSKAYGNVANVNRLIKADSGTSLYAAFNVTSTPTFATTTAIQIRFKFLRD